MKLNIYEALNYWIFQSDPRKKNQLKSRIQKETLHCTQTTNKQTNALLSIKRPTMLYCQSRRPQCFIVNQDAHNALLSIKTHTMLYCQSRRPQCFIVNQDAHNEQYNQ